jgi:1-acyl-sn-glycerol-3-phosphate acyltransferase
VENKISNSFKSINIREIFAAKNPRLAKILPGFVYSYLNRMIHVDFFNDFQQRNSHLTGIPYINKAVEEFNVKEHIHGVENIPKTGRFIFASNHPLGGFDGLLLIRNVDRYLGPSMFLINDILMNITNLVSMFVPFNKHGNQSRKAAKLLDETYRSTKQILIFPYGLASRRIKGKIVDLKWEKHFISKAIQYERDVIPVFISGKNSNRFYIIANLRKFFRIKWNLEMFFLPDEAMRHRNSDIHIYFGKPLSYKMFNKTKTHYEWANFVKSIVYSLPKNDMPVSEIS